MDFSLINTTATAVAVALPVIAAAGMVMSSRQPNTKAKTKAEIKDKTKAETRPVVENDGTLLHQEKIVEEESKVAPLEDSKAKEAKVDAKKAKKADKKKKAKKTKRAKKTKKSMIDMLSTPVQENAAPVKEEPASSQKVDVVKPAEEPDSNQTNVVVKSNKLGGLIGVGGMTLKIIQDVTNTTITLPDRDDPAATGVVSINGDDKQCVARAARIVTDLAEKGYCPLLEGKDFVESNVKVPISQVHEIIGKGGRIIKAIQDELSVRLNVPDTSNTGRKKVVKVSVAGAAADVEEARQVIKSIVRLHYHRLTHPGMSHDTVAVPEHLFSLVIGPRGSTIKHLQNSYEVKVNMPDAKDTAGANAEGKDVVIIGPTSGVKFAKQEIEKIVHRATHEEDYAEVETDSYGDDEEEVYEPWMNEFSPPHRQTSGATWA